MHSTYPYRSGTLLICLLLSLLIFQSGQLRAQVEVIQNRSVVTGLVSDDNPTSAKMNVNSKSQGMLIPRMLHTDMESIVAPADALMVFVTDADTEIRGFYYYDKKLEEWVKIPSIDCLSCENQFLGDANGNGIPDNIIESTCGTDCTAGANDAMISITSNINDLCEDSENYTSYEVFVDGVSVTDILSIDASGVICYESETINGTVVSIVLYTDCCCKTLELVSYPDCAVCEPQYTLTIDPLGINCESGAFMSVDYEVTLSCELCEETDCNSVYFEDWVFHLNNQFYVQLDGVTMTCGQTITEGSIFGSCSSIEPGDYITTSTDISGNLLCGDPIGDAITVDYGTLSISQADINGCCSNCSCNITNISGPNTVQEGNVISLTASLNCPQGWTQLTWDWGNGSTITDSPDNNILFGAGLAPGFYTVSVTATSNNGCSVNTATHVVEVLGEGGGGCECNVTNVFGPNSVLEGNVISLTASLSCPQGWSELTWDWGSGSTTTDSPDNNILFGAGLAPGFYTVSVTATANNNCDVNTATHVVQVVDTGGGCDCDVSAVADDENCDIVITVNGPDCANYSISVLKYGSQNGSCSNGNCSYLSNLLPESQTISGGDCTGNSSDLSDYKILLVPDSGNDCLQQEVCVLLDCSSPACENTFIVSAGQIDHSSQQMGVNSFNRLTFLELSSCSGVSETLWGSETDSPCRQDILILQEECGQSYDYCTIDFLEELAQDNLDNLCFGATIEASDNGLTWELTLPSNSCGYNGLILKGNNIEYGVDPDCSLVSISTVTATSTDDCNCN